MQVDSVSNTTIGLSAGKVKFYLTSASGFLSYFKSLTRNLRNKAQLAVCRHDNENKAKPQMGCFHRNYK